MDETPVSHPEIQLDILTPPVWVDVVFVSLMAVIHISYAIKFSKFSLQFLHAQSASINKENGRTSYTRLFLRSISVSKSKYELERYVNKPFAKLWAQISFIRYSATIIVFLSCIISLIIWLSLMGNFFFEFTVACIIHRDKGSLLGFLVIPLLLYTMVGCIKHILWSMSPIWSTILDKIGDKMSEEQSQKSQKSRARSLSSFTTKTSNVIPHLDTDISIQNTLENEGNYHKLMGFRAHYFIAVHWRLWWITMCVFATILAISRTHTIEGVDMNDSYIIRLLMRFLVLSALEWNIIYLLFSVSVSIYGHVSNQSIFSLVFDDKDKNDSLSNEEDIKLLISTNTKIKKNKNKKNNNLDIIKQYKNRKNNAKCQTFLRLFCLLDVFGIDEVSTDCWPRTKVMLFIIILISATVLIIIGIIVDSSLIRFHGEILISFYLGTIYLACKPRGIYYLWRFKEEDLQLRSDDDAVSGTTHADEISLTYRHSKLQRLLSSGVSQNGLLNDIEEEKEEETASLIMTTSTDNVDNEDNDALEIFERLYNKIYNQRNEILKKWENNAQGSLIKKYCCFPLMTIKILFNYYTSLLYYYRLYWLLILPFNYAIRPFSMTCGGESLIENIAKYDYKNTPFCCNIRTCGCCRGISIIEDIIRKIINSCKGICVCFIVYIIFVITLYLTIWLSNTIDPVVINDNNMLHNHSNSLITNNNMFHNHTEFKHLPICQLDWNGHLSVLDLCFYAQIPYELGVYKETPIQDTISMYFDHSLNVTNPTWKVIHYTTEEPVFLHVRNIESGSDLIGIRGTVTYDDMLQDISLYMSVALLQLFSLVVPVTAIAPHSFIIRLIYYASFFEGVIDDTIRSRYDEPVYEYSYRLLQEQTHAQNISNGYKMNSLYFVGHSLGGGISQSVAAQLYNMAQNHFNLSIDIKSLSVAAPGMIYSSQKFNIKPIDLYMTSVVITPQYDLLSKIDKHGGLKQRIECNERETAKCHLTGVIMCELFNRCDQGITKNKYLYQKVCDAKEKYRFTPQLKT